MRLYELPQQVQKMLASETLPRTVALSLLKINQPQVALVLQQALELAEQDVQEGRNRADREVNALGEKLKAAELSLAGVEVAGSKSEQRQARQASRLADRKLNEARSRQQTAQSRQPRLTADAISRATDNVPAARRGKRSGMSHKAVRTVQQRICDALNKDDAIWNKEVARSGRPFDRRDVKLMGLAFQMVLGTVQNQDAFEVLADFYAAEQRPGWTKPPTDTP
jgi:hypothetical protein